MNYDGSSLDLKPQLEEGVTNVKWLTKDQSIDCAKKSFKSIRSVWESFLAKIQFLPPILNGSGTLFFFPMLKNVSSIVELLYPLDNGLGPYAGN